MSKSANSNRLFLGIDGGGSKCRAILVDQDYAVLGEGVAGPGNPLRGMEIATSSIIEATRQALLCAGLPDSTMSALTVGAGLAGVNVPKYHALFREWQHPFSAFYLTSDLHIACLGAHRGQDGAVIIIGTGSCGLAQSGTQMLEIGGHGFPYGDNGSGAWFGLQMVHQVLLSMDGLLAQTVMVQELLNASQCNNQLELVQHFMHASPTLYAKYAPLVFRCAEQDDALALSTVRQGAAHINAIARRLLSINPPKLALIGGLADKLKPYLDVAVRENLVIADASPEWGAVWYAQRIAQR